MRKWDPLIRIEVNVWNSINDGKSKGLFLCFLTVRAVIPGWKTTPVQVKIQNSHPQVNNKKVGDKNSMTKRIHCGNLI